MKQPVSNLSDHLGYWLRQVSNHVSHAFAAKVAEKGVSVAEWVVLRLLFDGAEQSPSQLAETLGMTRGAVSKLADKLIAKALINRKASQEDGRAQHLSLTAKGKALVPVLSALADKNDEACFGCLSRQEQKQLIMLLRRLVERSAITAVPLE